jgi:hypothetical protein
MDLASLVRSLLAYDALSARQWVTDAEREGTAWNHVPRPEGLDRTPLALAAGVVELPRLRRLCEEEGPEPLRRRGFLAPPEFLTFA